MRLSALFNPDSSIKYSAFATERGSVIKVHSSALSFVVGRWFNVVPKRFNILWKQEVQLLLFYLRPMLIQSVV